MVLCELALLSAWNLCYRLGTSEDPKERARMQKNAELIQTHGHDAVLALMGRGVGEETATRLLRGLSRGNRVALLRAIHNAELQYAKTRR